jgi:hypothetical protein
MALKRKIPDAAVQRVYMGTRAWKKKGGDVQKNKLQKFPMDPKEPVFLDAIRKK